MVRRITGGVAVGLLGVRNPEVLATAFDPKFLGSVWDLLVILRLFCFFTPVTIFLPQAKIINNQHCYFKHKNLS